MSATTRRIEHQRDLGRDEVRSGLVHMPCHHGVGAAMSCNESNACIAGAEFASGERRCRIQERGSIGRPSCAHTHVRVRTQKIMAPEKAWDQPEMCGERVGVEHRPRRHYRIQSSYAIANEYK